MKVLSKNWRFLVLVFSFLIAAVVLIFRAYKLQVEPENRVAKVANIQFERTLTIIPRRASILDRKGRSLAVSISTPSIFLDPYLIKNPTYVAKQISPLLDFSRNQIENIIKHNKNKRFVWLKRQVNSEVEKKIQLLNIRGIGSIPEYKRQYVLGEVASSLLGFVSTDGKGLGGLEASYENILSGEKNTIQLKRDAKGRPLYENITNVASQNLGKSLYITIDTDLQYLVEKYLTQAMHEYGAKSAVAIVMNPKNGEIFSLADLPNFDPNDFSRYSQSNRRLKSITDPIEPGSVLKIFGVGEALEKNIVKFNSVINTPNKHIKIGRKIIHDAELSHEREQWSISDLIKFSSNVGMVSLFEKMGASNLEEIYNRVGFSQKTGIDLPGESKGIFNKWSEKKKLEWATMSFGQGIALTPMQIISAYASIANGGTRVTPHLLYKVEEGQDITKFSGKTAGVEKKIWSDKTIKDVKKLLQSVIQSDGSGKNAQVDGYHVAGKTGTSQKVDFENGGYKKGAYWSSFVGFVPVDNPKLVVYVMLDEPSEKFYYGGTVAAPLFSKIARAALRVETIRND